MWEKTFGLKIFREARGIAIARAITVVFASGVYFRKALMEMPRAVIVTMKNHRRMTVFHLYFIRMKIIANANANAKMRL